VIFETEDLLRHSHLIHSSTYQKGIVVVSDDDGSIAVCELVVEHPGLDLTSAGPARGWFYEVDSDGIWQRRAHPEECPCGDIPTHSRHLDSLTIIEHFLENHSS
jgi:hypothetical protein